jgi:tRNA dimethylallyltransferase
MRCVGYRQAWAALDAAGDSLAPGAPAWHGLRAQGTAATRQLAKRQLTWLRSMPRTVVACDAPDATAQGLAALATLIEAPA